MRFSNIIHDTISSGMAKYKAGEVKGYDDPEQIMMKWDSETKFVIGYIDLAEAKPEDSLVFAVHLIEQSADEGFMLAQFVIGNCYDEGYGVSRDVSKAMFWWQKAADQGLDDSMEKLRCLLTVILDIKENDLRELEIMICDGVFSKNEIIKLFMNNTSSARENGMVVLYQAITHTGSLCKKLNDMKSEYPYESRIPELMKRFAFCGQQLLDNYYMMEEWKEAHTARRHTLRTSMSKDESDIATSNNELLHELFSSVGIAGSGEIRCH